MILIALVALLCLLLCVPATSWNHGTLAAPETILLLANNDYNRSIGRRNILGLMG